MSFFFPPANVPSARLRTVEELLGNNRGEAAEKVRARVNDDDLVKHGCVLRERARSGMVR